MGYLPLMGGVGIAGYEGRVPCPYCSSTDCAGVRWDGDPNEALDNWESICGQTGRAFLEQDLLESAREHGLRRTLAGVVVETRPRRRPSPLAS